MSDPSSFAERVSKDEAVKYLENEPLSYEAHAKIEAGAAVGNQKDLSGASNSQASTKG